MHTFKIELSPENYWFLRADVKSAEDVLAMLKAIVDEAIQARRNAQVPPTCDVVQERPVMHVRTQARWAEITRSPVCTPRPTAGSAHFGACCLAGVKLDLKGVG